MESSNFPNHFQNESLKLIESLVELTSSAFYLVDPHMRHRGLVGHNIELAQDREYEKNYMEMDPLNPCRFGDSDDKVVSMDEVLRPQKARQHVYYLEFLKPLNYRYNADMFFRRDGKIVAVIAMLRSESLGDFTEAELTLLRKVQPFLEYTLNTVYLPERVSERSTIQQKYDLTDRELDVVEFVVAGSSNKVIARELALSVATVKTHLNHIFQKSGVVSRTELLSQVIADLRG